MFKDGLYLNVGYEGRIMMIVSADQGARIYVREFVNAEFAAGFLENSSMLEREELEKAEKTINTAFGYYTSDVNEPEDGYEGLTPYIRENR